MEGTGFQTVLAAFFLGLIPGGIVGSIIGAVTHHQNAYFWGFGIGGILGIVFGVFSVVENKQLEREREAKEMRTRIKRIEDEQNAAYNDIQKINEQVISLLEGMPEQLSVAHVLLDQADADFLEGAFAPFWDSIEKAANRLAAYEENIRSIKYLASKYVTNSNELVAKYGTPPPIFSLTERSIPKLSAGTSTSERMKAIVRKAQSDFQFSMIYEQRKTNRLLVEGFTSLAMALEEMTWQITSSIDSLNDSIRGIDVSVRQSLNELNTSSSEMSRSIDVQLSDMAEREQKALQILDNIQHRKLL